ncbi:hypothetical protein HZS_7031, partial [Henneguya salminicola]
MSESPAEVLYLLYNSSENILNSLHFLVKISSSANRPKFLSKKSFDFILKKICKKFPIASDFLSKENCSEITKTSQELIQETHPYYDVLVNVYNFKEAFLQVLRKLSGLTPKIKIEIVSLIFVPFSHYKPIFQFTSLKSSREFPFINSSKFLSEYFEPSKRFSEEFLPYQTWIEQALSGVIEEFRLSSLNGKQMQTTYCYNLSLSPKSLAIPTRSHFPDLNLRGYNTYYKWFTCFFYPFHKIDCALAFPNLISNDSIESCLNLLFSKNIVCPLHRDLYIFPCKELIMAIESNKTLSKKAKDINEYLTAANASFISFHKDRRDYFSSTLREAYLYIMDQPGILGPKLDRILMLLTLTFESIYIWFLHFNCDAYKSKKTTNDLLDLYNIIYFIPRNIFCIINQITKMMSFKGCIMKYSAVIRRYFWSFLTEYDAQALNHIKTLELYYFYICHRASGTFFIKDIDATYFQGFCQLTSYLKSNPFPEDYEPTDIYLSMRLDWLRMQVRSSSGIVNCCNNMDSCCILNNISFHTRAIDELQLMVDTCAPIRDLWFFPMIFNYLIHEGSNFPNIKRFASVGYGIYSDFNKFLEYLCPEERYILAEVLFSDVDDQLNFLAQVCVNSIIDFWNVYKEVNKNSSISTVVNIWLTRYSENKKDIGSKLRLPPIDLPGTETVQILRDESQEYSLNLKNNRIVKAFNILQENCEAFCLYKTIKILDHNFYPRQAVLPYLETAILKEFASLAQLGELPTEKGAILCPIRPSVAFLYINTFQQVLSYVGSLLDLNLDCLFYSCLLSHTLPKELSSGPSLAVLYAEWFTEAFLELDFQNGATLYSPIRLCFISKNTSATRADEYTDTFEMRSLAKILGPCGIKTIIDVLNSYVGNQLMAVKKFLTSFNVQFFETALKGSANLDSFFKKDRAAEELIFVLTKIGVILTLKTLLKESLKHTLTECSYPLHLALQYWKNNRKSKDEMVPKMFNALGYDTIFDIDFIEKLSRQVFIGDSDKSLWVDNFIFLLPFVIGYLAGRDTVEYLPQVDAFTNNSHLIINAFKTLIPQIYYHYQSNNSKTVESAMNNLCHLLSVLIIRNYNGTLFTGNQVK